MNIRFSGAPSPLFQTTAAANTHYLQQLNNKFSAVKVKAGNRLAYSENSTHKTTVVVDPRLLEKAGADEALSDKLEKKIGQVKTANGAFQSLKEIGRDLSVKGYTMDKRGNIVCHGKDEASQEEFHIQLGTITDSANFKNKIYEHFEVSPTDLLFSKSFADILV